MTQINKTHSLEWGSSGNLGREHLSPVEDEEGFKEEVT